MNLLRLLYGALFVCSITSMLAQKISKTQRIDPLNTISWKKEHVIVTKYDSIYNWTWDTTAIAGWRLVGKTINFVYDVNANLISEMHQNLINNNWVNDYKKSSTYINGKFMEGTTEEWDGNAWANYIKQIATYDSNDSLIKILGQIADGTGWENEYIFLYTYDFINNTVILDLQLWKNAAWKNDRKYFFAYDLNGNMIKDSIQKWNDTVWVNSFQSFHTFKNNKISSIITQNWTNSAWDNFSMQT